MRAWNTFDDFEKTREALVRHACNYDNGLNKIVAYDLDGFRFGFCCTRCETAFQFPYKESINDPRFATPELRAQLAAELQKEVEQRREEEPTYFEQREMLVKQFAKQLNEVWRDKYLPKLIGFREKGRPQKEGQYATFASTNSAVESCEREHLMDDANPYLFDIACMLTVRRFTDMPKLYSEENLHRALRKLSRQILMKRRLLALQAGHDHPQLFEDKEKLNALYAGFELLDIQAANADDPIKPLIGVVIWIEHKQPWCLCIDSSTTSTAS
jgi:hypothetical protein